MQPDWRRCNKRTFNSAARALEVISSPLHRLRVQLHLEAAKCDAAEDSLIKASQEVQKALALDYVASPEEQALFQLERPLDRSESCLAWGWRRPTASYELPLVCCLGDQHDERTLAVKHQPPTINFHG